MLLILFAMAFLVGPALFLLLAQFDGRLWPLALISSVLVVLSLALRNEAVPGLGLDRWPVFFSVFLIWLSWIMVLVLVVRALRRAYPLRPVYRWSRAVGAMGTTVPWFGFAAAQMMVV